MVPSVAGAHAADDVQDLAGDELGVLEEDDSVDDVCHFAHATHRVQRREGRMRPGECIVVWIVPGATAWTRMPQVAYSMA